MLKFKLSAVYYLQFQFSTFLCSVFLMNNSYNDLSKQKSSSLNLIGFDNEDMISSSIEGKNRIFSSCELLRNVMNGTVWQNYDLPEIDSMQFT